MFVILWEFEVKPGSEDRFEIAYGPGGAWVRLFHRDPHYRGTQLLRDPSRTLLYFTIDYWDSENAYCDFLKLNRAAYDEIDRTTEGRSASAASSLSSPILPPRLLPDNQVNIPTSPSGGRSG
jgi:heme-degrading monooxygenase HmoA